MNNKYKILLMTAMGQVNIAIIWLILDPVTSVDRINVILIASATTIVTLIKLTIILLIAKLMMTTLADESIKS